MKVIAPANTAGMRWLAQLHPDPASCLDRWIRGQLVQVPLGSFATLSVSAGLGLAALHTLVRAQRACPALHDRRRAAVDFLIQPAGLHVPAAIGVLGHDGTLPCPPPGRGAAMPGLPPAGDRPAHGTRWLIEPDGSGALWRADVVLRAVERIYAAASGAETDDGVPESAPPAGTRRRSLASFFTGARTAKTSDTCGN